MSAPSPPPPHPTADQADACKFLACDRFSRCVVNGWTKEARCLCRPGYVSVDGLTCQSLCDLQPNYCRGGDCYIVPEHGARCRYAQHSPKSPKLHYSSCRRSIWQLSGHSWSRRGSSVLHALLRMETLMLVLSSSGVGAELKMTPEGLKNLMVLENQRGWRDVRVFTLRVEALGLRIQCVCVCV